MRSVSGVTASGGQRAIGPLHSLLAAAGDSPRTNIKRSPVRLQSMAGRDVLYARGYESGDRTTGSLYQRLILPTLIYGRQDEFQRRQHMSADTVRRQDEFQRRQHMSAGTARRQDEFQRRQHMSVGTTDRGTWSSR